MFQAHWQLAGSLASSPQLSLFLDCGTFFIKCLSWVFVFILLVKTLYFLFMVGQNTVVFGVITSAAAAVTAYDWYRKAQLEKVKNFM